MYKCTHAHSPQILLSPREMVPVNSSADAMTHRMEKH